MDSIKKVSVLTVCIAVLNLSSAFPQSQIGSRRDCPYLRGKYLEIIRQQPDPQVISATIQLRPVDLAQLGSKPGRCPRPRGPGICVEECTDDSVCPGNWKCCSNGCGQTCQFPIDGGSKLGRCPRPRGPGTCAEECTGDSDCPGSQKCCSNGCGHTCQLPVGGGKPGCRKVFCIIKH